MRATTAPAPAVLHVEDEEYFASVLATLISRNPDFSYAGLARSAAEALAMCRETEPAIVLLDLWLPDGDGLRLIDKLAVLPRPPRIILLTVRQDDLTLYRAWVDRERVSGLVWKTSRCHEHLPAALAAVAKGGRYFPPDVAQAIYNFRTSKDAFHKLITPWHHRFLDGFARGESDEHIAASLGITPKGVHTQKKRIMGKLGLHRFHELVLWTLERGFGGKPPPGLGRAPGRQVRLMLDQTPSRQPSDNLITWMSSLVTRFLIINICMAALHPRAAHNIQ